MLSNQNHRSGLACYCRFVSGKAASTSRAPCISARKSWRGSPQAPRRIYGKMWTATLKGEKDCEHAQRNETAYRHAPVSSG